VQHLVDDLEEELRGAPATMRQAKFRTIASL
jgi:hypothetical protein